MKEITIERLRTLLSYDPETGDLTWLARPRSDFADDRSMTRWHSTYAGTVASHIGNKGYIIIHIAGQNYLGHRFAWALHFGVWPKGQIDHINGTRNDNRLVNMRDVTRTVNARNARRGRNNKSGVTGVCWAPSWGCWIANIGVDGKNIVLGRFSSKDEAARVRKDAERRYGFHPNHGSAAA